MTTSDPRKPHAYWGNRSGNTCWIGQHSARGMCSRSIDDPIHLTSNDLTPSDHDELLARTATHRSDGVGGGVALIRELETALRTEQSARQAAERRIDAAYKALTRPVPNGANRTAALAALTTPTESKEPDPKLVCTCYLSGASGARSDCQKHGIEVPHE